MRDRLYALADRLMRENGLDKEGWTFGINPRAIRRLGQCSYRRKRLEISGYVVKCAPYQFLANIVIHEVAHALCPGNCHDRIWATKAWQLGATVVERVTSLQEHGIVPNDRDMGFKFVQVLLIKGRSICQRIGGSKTPKKNISLSYLPSRRVETLGNIHQIPVAVYEAYLDDRIMLGDVHIYAGIIDNADGRYDNKAQAIVDADVAVGQRKGRACLSKPTKLAKDIIEFGMTFDIFTLKYLAAKPATKHSTLRNQYSRANMFVKDRMGSC